MNDVIELLVVDLSKDPFNARKNFECAVEYEKLNQTASAVSFYLRTAEYGTEADFEIVYTSLLRVARCFEDQIDRKHTVSNSLLQAIAYLPYRQEAYFLLAQFYERSGQWQECYTWATIGLRRQVMPPLPVDVGYHGPYCLEFEKAVSAWWVGRKNESIDSLVNLNAREDLAPEYKIAVAANLERLGIVTV